MAEAAELPPEPISWTPERLEALIRATAKKYGLNEEKFLQVAKCESVNLKDPTIQSGYFHNGVREKSFGIFQINIDYNDVTIEQAIDPEFAVEWSAQEWLRGHQSKWSCY